MFFQFIRSTAEWLKRFLTKQRKDKNSSESVGKTDGKPKLDQCESLPSSYRHHYFPYMPRRMKHVRRFKLTLLFFATVICPSLQSGIFNAIVVSSSQQPQTATINFWKDVKSKDNRVIYFCSSSTETAHIAFGILQKKTTNKNTNQKVKEEHKKTI